VTADGARMVGCEENIDRRSGTVWRPGVLAPWRCSGSPRTAASRVRRIIAALVIAWSLVGFARTAAADEPRAEFRLGDRSDTPHAGVPFSLDLIVEGFDESPPPEVPKLAIADANITFVAIQPNVQHGMQIVNGRRSDFVRVTWVVRWRVEPHKPGGMKIPSVTITQGSKKATAQSAEAQVDTVQTSDAMKLALGMPDRPIFVGETVPVTLTWLFRTQPQDDPRWSIPLMTSDAFTVSGPPSTTKGKALTFPAGAKELQLPYQIDQVEQNGQKFNRLTATFFIAPRKTGKIDVPASSVVVSLPVGRADFFGNAPSELFRALDVARTIEVKPLPETDRPASFAGAVGEQFSIEVRTSRSVVQLGEPFDLDIQVKSNQRLDTLSLGKLDGPGGLPRDKFTVPADPPTGELSDDGKSKTFKVTAQVAGAVTELPAVAFSYFDPTKGLYQTIHSEPIALSVKGGSVVGADEVIATKPKTGSAAPVDNTDALVNADLALSSTGDLDATPIGGTMVWLLVGLLYAIPIVLLAARTWQLRTAGQREEAAEVRSARKKVEELLDRAGTAPAPRDRRPAGRSTPRPRPHDRPRRRRWRPARQARDRGVRTRERRRSALARPALRYRRPPAAVDLRGAAVARPAQGGRRAADPRLARRRPRRRRRARRRPRRVSGGDAAHRRRDRAQGRVQARRDPRLPRRRARRRITRSCRPTGATPRSVPVTSRPPRSRIAVRS